MFKSSLTQFYYGNGDIVDKNFPTHHDPNEMKDGNYVEDDNRDGANGFHW